MTATPPPVRTGPSRGVQPGETRPLRTGRVGLPRRARRPHPIALLGLGWALLLVTWAVTNAPFASPDEPAHYVRAVGVATGNLAGSEVVSMPPGLWGTFPPGGSTCNAGQSTVPATCLAGIRANTTALEVFTSAGRYPPTAYALPGLAIRAADDPYTALRAGRLVTAAVTLALLMLAAALLYTGSAPGLSLVGLVAAVTPMVLFVGASVSSSALEIAAGVAFFAALLRLSRGPARPRWVWGAALASGLALASTRTAGIVWVAVDLLVVGGLAWRGRGLGRLRADVRRPLAALAAVAIAGLVFNRVWEGAYGSAITQRGIVEYGGLRIWLVHGVQQLGRVLDEFVGDFGWLDSKLPPIAYPTWQAFVAALLGATLLVASRRELLALAAAIGGFLTSAVLISASLMASTGQDVQGRHVLPLAVTVPILAGEILVRNRDRLVLLGTNVLVTTVAVGAGLIQVVALWASGRRNAVGDDGAWLYFASAAWNPPLGWWLWAVVAALGGVLAAAALPLAARRAR